MVAMVAQWETGSGVEDVLKLHLYLLVVQAAGFAPITH